MTDCPVRRRIVDPTASFLERPLSPVTEQSQDVPLTFGQILADARRRQAGCARKATAKGAGLLEEVPFGTIGTNRCRVACGHRSDLRYS